jgi:hypothetical protein
LFAKGIVHSRRLLVMNLFGKETVCSLFAYFAVAVIQIHYSLHFVAVKTDRSASPIYTLIYEYISPLGNGL